MPEINQRFVLASRPAGMPSDENFQLESSPVPEPGEGEIVVRVLYLSVDPYMRGRMKDAASYAAPTPIGGLMTGGGVGRVTASRNARFAVGDIVMGDTGWQTHCVTDGRGFRKVDPALAPISTSLGVLGMPGLTAYFGLLEVGALKDGETVVVSGAAGAVGSLVGQIAKIHWCRVVGVAGADDKVQWLTGELGFDAAFNYKTVEPGQYRAKLAELCPGGIDVYFDNVGGPITDAVFPLMNVHARVVVCGQIHHYNDTKAAEGPRHLFHLVIKRARVEGFLVFDFAARYEEGLTRMAAWLREGKLKYREQVYEGIENVPRAFIGMLGGENTGKMVVKVGE
jgi:NADPH-dependent curcumin reductase CurA